MKYTEISREDFDVLCQRGVHQGIAGVLLESPNLDISDFIDKCLEVNPLCLVLVLDQIEDPQNLGSIFRSAEAFGVQGIVKTINNTAPISPLVRKSSVGATELVPYTEVMILRNTIKEFKKKGFWIAGSALQSDSSFIKETDLPRPLVLIAGSEGKGLRPLTIKECDFLVKIPMKGKIQSLNVGQAVSVLLYELMRCPK